MHEIKHINVFNVSTVSFRSEGMDTRRTDHHARELALAVSEPRDPAAKVSSEEKVGLSPVRRNRGIMELAERFLSLKHRVPPTTLDRYRRVSPKDGNPASESDQGTGGDRHLNEVEG